MAVTLSGEDGETSESTPESVMLSPGSHSAERERVRKLKSIIKFSDKFYKTADG